MNKKINYKETLNLPKTTFPMKANLPQMEPKILARWQELELEKKLLAPKPGKKQFILHDGPPYANGNIHLGHTLNKVLKDIIVKYKTMAGYYAPFVPGWDCHGQPIEHEVEKKLGKHKKEISQAELRARCREYALNFVEKQKEQFKRLGITGDWENPYLTLDPVYEAVNVKVFNDLYQKGLVYKGKKPIHWCYRCQTALAEAEIEYAEELSPSIYVKFPLLDIPQPAKSLKAPLNLVIWTTTPWTLPANVGVAVHPEADYAVVKANSEHYILAKALIENLTQVLGKKVEVLTAFRGQALLNLKYHHPLFEKEGVIVTADFVSLDQGTGCVHIAPGHGEEDYLVGLKYKLPSPMPVNDVGVFTAEAGQYAGLTVDEANQVIVADLKNKGLLLAYDRISHAYPHCWRCKNPVIFRATEQWFISLTERDLRGSALKAIQEVKWIPDWSIRRISGMVKERPDWCISRQRAWGVPIPVFYCQKCRQVLASYQVLKRIEEIFAREGADSWFKKTAAELLGPEARCLNCGHDKFTKETDILDVWFESGISHAAVLQTRPELSWPADLYLEGSDQHRGWFQSSLLTSVGMNNKPPYKSVLTHGFLVDGQGRKMSKSLGNVVDPLEVIPRAGADILRLWVSSADYSSDIAVSDEILERIGETYRRMRNTIRFILGNLYDFNPKLHAVAYPDLERVDKWALMRLHQVIQRVNAAYENYRFHQVYHTLYNFCTVDLSAFYLDILKDRLYTYGANAQVRRSAQTALHQIIVALLKMLAPILVFTADEAWQYLPEAHLYEPTVHLSSLPEYEPAYIDLELQNEWEKLLKIRSEVAKAVELARESKLIGSSLEAKITLYLPNTYFEIATNYQKQLPEILIASQCFIYHSADGLPEAIFRSEVIPDLGVKVAKADGGKCERCWNWRLDVGKSKQHPSLCQRCLEAIGIQSFVLEEKEL